MRDSTEPLPLADVLRWNSDGLIPAVVQDVETGDVLMLAWMDEPALRATIATGQTHFYSRSRRSHWHKGGTSGHVQHVESLWVDCDGDVILIKARQVGGACHEGYRSCFFRRLGSEGWEVAARPVFDAAAVYGPAEGAETEAVETNSHESSVFDLRPSEKLRLVEDLWNDLAASSEPVLVHDWQKEELARRNTNLLNNPASGLTWEEVRRRVTAPSVQVGPGPEPAEG